MRRLLTLALLASVPLSLSATADTPADANGTWMRGDGNARVRIEPCGSDVCAINIWIKDTSGGEEVGDKLVMSVKPKGDNVLVGTAFDPKRNLTYSMQMTVEKDRLETKGCVINGMICKNTTWSRAQ